MALINPMGLICGSTQPIVKHYFDYLITSPAGTFSGTMNLEDLRAPAIKQMVGVIDYTPFNSVFPVPGVKQSVRDSSFTFRFLDGTTGWNFWKGWMKKVYDEEFDAVGLFNEVAGQCIITIYRMTSAKGEPTPFGTITIRDCWPSSIGADDLDMASDGDIFTYSVTLQGLDVIVEVN